MPIVSIMMPLFWGRFAFKFPSLAKRYNILTDTPKSSAKSFGS